MVVILWRFYHNMPKKRLHHIPLFSTRATATVSVALVLVILGIAALVGLATHGLSRSVRDNMGFVVIFSENVTAADIAQVTDKLKAGGGVRDIQYSSPDDILARWQKMVGEDEDIMKLADVNPFTSELEVKVTDTYASTDSIMTLAAPVMLMPQVSDVKIHNELIDSVNSTLRSISLTLVAVAVALMIVSFVLIFNTVRLSVYSRRFLINTMQLVGATPGFVRRPFILESLVNGAVAGGAGIGDSRGDARYGHAYRCIGVIVTQLASGHSRDGRNDCDRHAYMYGGCILCMQQVSLTHV